ncbi:MAG: amidohydrolase family protein [Sedimentisphaerales bacterium]|nr:amidohydrolase family protein [Sedimentisphaerales bacterium]
MIVDCHSHIWPSLNRLDKAQGFSCLGATSSTPAKPEEHLESSGPAEYVIVLGFASKHLNAEIPNSFIQDYVTAHADRMIGFAGIDPTDPGCFDNFSQILEEKHFAGIVLSPACQKFHPCNTNAMKLYEQAQDNAMPIYFLQGEVLPASAILDYAQPAALDEVARCFPELKIVISHMGFPWIEQALALLAKHSNIFADVAGLAGKVWQTYRSLTLAYEYGVIEKLLFGSDFPAHTVKTAAEALYNINKITLDSVLPAVPREQVRSIVERNSLELLGLSIPKSSSAPVADDASS